MLDRPQAADRRRRAARARQKRSRKRHKAGRAILPVEIPECALIEALIVAGYLAEPDAGDRERVKAAAGTVEAVDSRSRNDSQQT